MKEWENTPDYRKYAVTMMDWQGNLATAVSEMARKSVARHDQMNCIFIRRKNTCVVTYSAPHTCTEVKALANKEGGDAAIRDFARLIRVARSPHTPEYSRQLGTTGHVWEGIAKSVPKCLATPEVRGYRTTGN